MASTGHAGASPCDAIIGRAPRAASARRAATVAPGTIDPYLLFTTEGLYAALVDSRTVGQRWWSAWPTEASARIVRLPVVPCMSASPPRMNGVSHHRVLRLRRLLQTTLDAFYMTTEPNDEHDQVSLFNLVWDCTCKLCHG